MTRESRGLGGSPEKNELHRIDASLRAPENYVEHNAVNGP
jgi:hypothetical protein